MYWNNNLVNRLGKQKDEHIHYHKKDHSNKYCSSYEQKSSINYNKKNNNQSNHIPLEIPDNPYDQSKRSYQNQNSVYKKTQYKSFANQYNDFWEKNFDNYSSEKFQSRSPSPNFFPSVSPSPRSSPSPPFYPSVSPSPVPNHKKQRKFNKMMILIIIFILIILILL